MNRKLTMMLVVSLLAVGCGAKAEQVAVKATDHVQVATEIIPCDTDTDCEEKNGAVHTCEAFTKAGHRCTRKVSEAGLLCKQHSKMVKAGKSVKTVQ